jgi:trk system potassium uptake protein TrkH
MIRMAAHSTGPERIFLKDRSITAALDRSVGLVAVAAVLLLLVEQAGVPAEVSGVLAKINFGILALFLVDAAARILIAPRRISHLLHNWFDLIVLIPLVQIFIGDEGDPSYILIRQIVIVSMLISRTRKSQRFIRSLGLRPTQLMITSFSLTICLGAVLLTLPISSASGQATPLLDALFTATSATCVTGLVVRDTAVYFSRFGQVVILALIQLGGLGIMTFSVFLALLGGRRIGMTDRLVMKDVLDSDILAGASRMVVFIFLMTFSIELMGSLGLFLAWSGRFGSAGETAYHAVFHSVSAFCNAGFSTFSDSLTGFAGDVATNVTVCLLIIAGGLGFLTVKNIFDTVGARLAGDRRTSVHLRVQPRIVLTISLVLIATGALAFAAFETGGDSVGSDPTVNVLAAVFQSVTARTAGFNTIDIGRLLPSTLFTIIILMFIGASPGSTGGGLKTTTFAVLWGAMTREFSDRQDVVIYRKTIPTETIQKAVSVLLFYLLVVVSAVIALLAIEPFPLIDILFETVSAVATVGLSTGITSHLSPISRAIVIFLMFFGRLGPLTLGYALLLSNRRREISYAEERVMIG